MEKVNKKIKELKSRFKFSKVKQVRRDRDMISHLNILLEQYVMWPIDKAAKKHCIYMYEILCTSTPKRIRFIKYYIKYLSKSE